LLVVAVAVLQTAVGLLVLVAQVVYLLALVLRLMQTQFIQSQLVLVALPKQMVQILFY
jgi:hypothetical protein